MAVVRRRLPPWRMYTGARDRAHASRCDVCWHGFGGHGVRRQHTVAQGGGGAVPGGDHGDAPAVSAKEGPAPSCLARHTWLTLYRARCWSRTRTRRSSQCGVLRCGSWHCACMRMSLRPRTGHIRGRHGPALLPLAASLRLPMRLGGLGLTKLPEDVAHAAFGSAAGRADVNLAAGGCTARASCRGLARCQLPAFIGALGAGHGQNRSQLPNHSRRDGTSATTGIPLPRGGHSHGSRTGRRTRGISRWLSCSPGCRRRSTLRCMRSPAG